MSEVFSFRLSEDNPREVKAKEVIETRISQGYSLRYVLTEALIRYGGKGNHREEMVDFLEQLKGLVSQPPNGRLLEGLEANDKKSLSSTFIEAVKKSVKPGEKLT
jgi:hypothetical protein